MWVCNSSQLGQSFLGWHTLLSLDGVIGGLAKAERVV